MAGRARRAIRSRVIPVVLAVAAPTAALVTFGWLAPSASRALAPSAVGEFHPLPVTRVLDSRGTSPAKAVTMSGSSFDVNLTRLGAVMPADPSLVLGVIANVTVTGASVDGYLTTGPAGQARSDTSTVNFVDDSAVANLALLRPDSAGFVTLTLVANSGSGSASVIIDVFGYLSSATGERGSRFITTPATRLLDTRQTGDPLGGGGWATLPIRGADGFSPTIIDVVPDDPSVDAVALTVTVDNHRPTSTETWVSVVPERGSAQPNTSNVNLGADSTRANLVIVPIGVDGSVRIFNAKGSADVIVDLVGYFRTGADGRSLGGRIIPIDRPLRVADSRPVPLAAGQTDHWDLAPFLDSLDASGRRIGTVDALFTNLTATRLTRTATGVPVSSYLTLYPTGTSRPGTSNVNADEGVDSANAAVTRLTGERSLSVYNAFGSLDYVIDVFGIILGD